MSKIADFMIGGGSSSGLATAYTTLNAGEAIAKGDLVAIAQDGNAYWCNDPRSAISPARPVASSIGGYNLAASAFTAVAAAYTNIVSSTLLLSNGNIAYFYSIGTTLYFAIYSQAGAQVVAQTQIATGFLSQADTYGNQWNFSALALSGGGFAVVYATTGVNLAIYSNSGAVVLAPASIVTGTVACVGICQMSNSNLAIGYTLGGTSYALGFAIYTPIGVKVTGPTNADSSTSACPISPQMAIAASSTGFVLGAVYALGVMATAKFYNEAFTVTLTGTVTSLFSAQMAIASGSGTNAVSVSLATLTSGNVAMYVGWTNYGGGSNAQLKYINASASTYTSLTLPTMTSNGGYQYGFVYPMPGGNFLAAYTNAGNVTALSIYNASLAVVASVLPPSNQTPLSQCSMTTLNDGSLIASTAAGVLYRFNGTTLASIGAAIVTGMTGLVSLTPVSANPAISAYGGGFGFVAFGTSGGYAGTIAYANQAPQQSFVGVAAAAAAKGAPVTVQVLGGASTRLMFSSPYVCNLLSAAIPGQKASLIGTLAILNGIQAPSVARNIN